MSALTLDTKIIPRRTGDWSHDIELTVKLLYEGAYLEGRSIRGLVVNVRTYIEPACGS
jgi:hypothetical protein